MREDYLWDGSGEPDPDVERLERLLGEFRSTRPAPDLPAANRWSHTRRIWSAVAAGLAIAVAGAWLASRTTPEGWRIARAGHASSRLAVGETLETGTGHATVNVGDIGVLEVEPNSVLRLVTARKNQQRMSLERGTIHAMIWAPPRSFVVDTPSAVATDLGCFYTLRVSPDGGGLLTVEAGWVGFDRDGRESFIPAGAACQTRRGAGPGTPYREEASPALREALEKLDFAGGGDAALHIVLAEAGPNDAFTLWHLLTRVNRAQMPQVYETLAGLNPPPAGVTRDGVLRGDRAMLDRWWDQLGLGDTTWWRLHEGRWPEGTSR
jgi:hypothetical protein